MIPHYTEQWAQYTTNWTIPAPQVEFVGWLLNVPAKG